MLIRIYKDWDFPDIMQQTPIQDGVWGDLQFTEDALESADLLIVLNRPSEPIKMNLPEGGKWLFSQESPIPSYRWHTRSFRQFDKVFTFWQPDSRYGRAELIHTQTALPWHAGLTYQQLQSISLEEARMQKSDEVSWITSNLNFKPGHILRMSFLKYLQENKFDFKLFGRGFTPIENKFEGLYPFKYSLAVENYACPDYWTEKIADCFLSWTVPIYYGATNIDSYFPKGSMIHINPNEPEKALNIIKEAVNTDYWSKNIEALSEARQLILDKYQFFPWVEHLLKKHQPNLTKRKYYFMAKNVYGKRILPSYLVGKLKCSLQNTIKL